MLEEIIGEEPLDLSDTVWTTVMGEDLDEDQIERAFCIDYDFPNRPVPVWG